jgi:hypothetical protein
MKKVFYATLVLFALNISAYAAETKKVCQDKKDKSGKVVQECKEIKVHKKLDTKK